MLAQTSRILLEAEALGSILRILAGHVNRARIFFATQCDVGTISLWHVFLSLNFDYLAGTTAEAIT